MSCSHSAAHRDRVDVVTRAATVLVDAEDMPPGLVVLLADDNGLLLATRKADFGMTPLDVELACARLLDLAPPTGPAAAVVISFDPDFDVEDRAVSQAWADMRRRFERCHALMADWLLVTGATSTSVATSCGEPVP